MLTVLRTNTTQLTIDATGLVLQDAGGHVTGLPTLRSLKVWECRNCGLTSLTGMRSLPPLPSLQSLDVSSNRMTNIDGSSIFAFAPFLRRLYFDRNRIRDVSPTDFNNALELELLSLQHNPIKSVMNLRPLAKLRTLFLSGTRIAEPLGSEEIEHFHCLEEISLQRTPAYRKPLYRLSLVNAHPRLRRIDDMNVTDDERQRVERLFLARGSGSAEGDGADGNFAGGIISVPASFIAAAPMCSARRVLDMPGPSGQGPAEAMRNPTRSSLPHGSNVAGRSLLLFPLSRTNSSILSGPNSGLHRLPPGSERQTNRPRGPQRGNRHPGYRN
eukprot:GHVT01014278.1.p1 GENE.GHVT01014278.1~~GHVT01014278.1.p1  ORF type:complete len:328 (-),score=35.82 GHVT01014278.1:273-1256(-)